MAKPEAYRVDAILKWLKEVEAYHPIFVFRTHQTGKTKKGIPDLHVIFYGAAIWIEAKKDSKQTPTEIQAKRIDQIRRAFGYSICTANVVDVRALLMKVLDDNAGRLFCPKCRTFTREGFASNLCGCPVVLRRIPPADQAFFPPIKQVRK